MQKKTKIKISLFSGGSGNDRFINLIKNISGVEIDILLMAMTMANRPEK